MKSLKFEIFEAVKKVYPNSYPIDDIFAIAEMTGHKQSLAERKCRELCHNGFIRAIKNDRGFVRGYILQSDTKPFTVPLKEIKQERLFTPRPIRN